MSENLFKKSLAAIANGYYEDSDIKNVKTWVQELRNDEKKIKNKIDKSKKEYVKDKEKAVKNINDIKSKIKQINTILKQAKEHKEKPTN